MSLYEKIRFYLDIVEVISEYIPLKRVGNSYAANCPFHPDRSPSLYVSPSKGIWKCFGCGKGGDVIKFVAEYENLSYFEAAKLLIERYNLPIVLENKDEKESEYFKALRLINEFYKNNLTKSVDAKNYLLKVRKIPPSLVESFELGYCGDGYKSVNFARKEKILDQLLELKHFFKTADGRIKDFFYNRITIPIKNPTGKIAAFGGRALSDELKPKYKNSPNSFLFQKEKFLFGLERAKEAVRERNFLLLVEGYFDVIRLHSVGFRNCVAPLGTSFTDHHARVIKKLTGEVILLFDGDTAGKRAAFETAKKLLKANLDVLFAFLPEGEDPDTFVLKGGLKALRELLNEAKPVKDYLIERALNSDLQKVEKIAKVYKEYAKLIPDPIKRELWLKEFRNKVGIPLSKQKTPKVKTLVVPKGWDTAEVGFLLGLLFLEPENVDLEEYYLSLEAKKIAKAILEGEKEKLPDWLLELDTTDLNSRFEVAKRKLLERKLHSEELFKNLYLLEERIKEGKASKEELKRFKLLLGELNKVQRELYRKFKEQLRKSNLESPLQNKLGG